MVGGFRVTLGAADKFGPVKGDLVYTNFEIAKQGLHSVPYARVIHYWVLVRSHPGQSAGY